MSSSPSIEAIGFVGLGVMGEAICRNLLRKSGLPVTVFDVVDAPMERLMADGAQAASSPAGVASDVVFCSLPGDPQLEDVVAGRSGVLAGLVGQRASRPTIVDLGTSSVKRTRELASRAAEAGVDYCDAPVARTRQAAIDGTLAVMIGGEPDVVERVRPLLGCFAADITYCGAVGSGQIVKQLNNMVLFQNVLAVAEAHAIGTAAGLSGSLVLEALSKGSADSFALRNHGMKAILRDDYPRDAFSTLYAMKDVDYALELAAEYGVPARGAELVRRVLEESRDAGWAHEYFPVLRRTIGSDIRAQVTPPTP